MTYSEKAGLEAEKAARIEVHNEHVLLRVCISSMFSTDSMGELCRMHDSARKGLEKIYAYHEARVRQLHVIGGGGS